MKRLKHKFIRNKNNPKLNIVTGYDICVFCGKSGFNLFDELSENDKNALKKSKKYKRRSFINDCSLYNKYNPCITEEEYIIKNIIE